VTPPPGQRVRGSATKPRDPREAARRATIDRHDNGQAHRRRTGVDRSNNGQAQHKSTLAQQVIDVEEEQVREAMWRSQLESKVVEVSESDEEDGNTEQDYDSDVRSAIQQSRRDAQRQAWLEEEQEPEMQEALERSRLESEPAARTLSVTGGRGGSHKDAGPGPRSVSSVRPRVATPPQSERQWVQGFAGMVVESSESDGDIEGEERGRETASGCPRRKLFGNRTPPAQLASTLGGTSGTALCGWHDASSEDCIFLVIAD
jgi:hypothetical protein